MHENKSDISVHAAETENVSMELPEEDNELLSLDFDDAEYSDGEEVVICRHCKLPLGELGYTYGEDDECPLHGECAAQLMLCAFKNEEKSRDAQNKKVKQTHRKQYDIGWNVEEAPSNAFAAEQMGCCPAPQGMCCLVFDEDSHSVHVAPTLEPAESLNLEYLSLSLRIRLREGREPLFSLDPVDSSSTCEKEGMQFKRFEPEWIAGTSVGEIMFQADYHLKELSMGEYTQPVVGMRSAFDFAERDGVENEWSGREWFIVRKAEVLLTEDSVVVPRVKMGVEAREQVLQGDQLVDVRSTRKDHPLVQYADAFTHNFDLIAERKSVVFHLRELAKASVVAKMLIDGAVNLEGPWFDLGGQAKELCPLEIPQLWLQREHAQIRLQDGKIVEDEEGGFEQRRCRGLYGGVNFGLERAAVSMPSVVSRGRISSLSARPALSRLSAGSKPSASVSAAAVGVSMPSLITRGRMSLVSKPAALTTKLAPAASVAAAGVSMPSMISRGRMASLAARPAVGLSAVTAPSVSAAAARPAVGLSSVTAGLARPATGLASVTAGLAPRPAVSLQTSKMMTVTQTRAPGLMPQRPSVGLSAVTTARPAAGLSAVTTRLAAPARPAAGISAVTARLSAAARPAAGLSAAQTRLGKAALPASALSASSFPQRLGVAPAAGLSAVSRDARGVDLNLDQFSLSSPVRMEEGAAWIAEHGVKCSAMGSAFWSSLDGEESCFRPEDKQLLKAIYDPILSDRRQEGDRFVPPDTRFDYVQKLRTLVNEETACREKRVAAFLGDEFSITNPGSLFPSSWAPSGKIDDGKSHSGPLHAVSFKDQEKFGRMLKSITPSFDKTSEAGMRFRIYSLGDMEVRTTQEARQGSKEVIGAVFSKNAITAEKSSPCDSADEDWSKLKKVTEYVEWAKDGRRSYVVLETEEGSVFVTEKLPDGKIAWEKSSSELEHRNALAKVVRFADGLEKGIMAVSLKWELLSHQKEERASCSDSKNFAQIVYSRAIGEAPGKVYTGFRKK